MLMNIPEPKNLKLSDFSLLAFLLKSGTNVKACQRCNTARFEGDGSTDIGNFRVENN